MVILVHGNERDKFSMCFTKCTDTFIYSLISSSTLQDISAN
jgi:hypothetical protein